MNPLFARQVRRRLGVDDPGRLKLLLQTLQTVVGAHAPDDEMAILVRQLPHFLETVEQTYAQSERDQALRNRSMAISSAELSEANLRLREAATRQQAVIDAMRATADQMLAAAGKDSLTPGETSLEALSQTVVELVQDREDTRRRLADSEARFRSLTAISSDWYWQQDEQFRYTFVSAGADTLKTSSNGFVGKRRWEVDDIRIDPERLQAHIADLEAHRAFRDFEYLTAGHDGHPRWVSTSGDPLFDDQGRFLGYRGTGKDITERRRDEALIAENLRLIEALLESIPDAIAIRSPDGTIIRVNAAFQRLFGRPGSELVGETNLPALLASPEQTVAESQLLRHGGVHRCQVQQDTDTEGTSKVFLAQRASFQGDQSTIAGMVITLTDITELEHTRRQALSAQRTAEHAMKVRSQFLANMSHEVRTPMNGVLGIAGLLLDTPLTEQQRELTGLLQTSGRALLTILNDILDFSKIEAGKVRLENTPFSLRETVRQQVAMFAATAREQGLGIGLTVDETIADRVSGDPTRLGQVLSNLIGNALKFTEKGSVRIHVEPAEPADPAQAGLIRISVTDTGVGIDASVQAKIFDAFSQADDSTTRRFGGTGLGLTICRNLVTMMGGEIGLESTPGQGSRFWFTLRLLAAPETENKQPATPALPATESGSTSTAAAAARRADKPLHDLKILLAEDNLVNQRVARTMLGAMGCRVTVVGDGDAAIAAASAEDFDLILMDCHMPGTDGFGATAALRALEAKTGSPRRVIIAQTAMAMQGDREQCLAAGMDDYITKPFTRADLTKLLAHWAPIPADHPIPDR